MNDATPASAPAHPLLALIELGRRARAAESTAELGFLAVNDTRELVAYRQAALWMADGGVLALSGVVAVEGNVPYTQWLERLCRALAAHQGTEVGAVDVAALPADVRLEWRDWLPEAATWVPLAGANGGNGAEGGLLLAGDAPVPPPHYPLLSEWREIWLHAWRARAQRQSWSPLGWAGALRRGWQRGSTGTRRRRGLIVGGVVLAALACPVRLTVLAPGELVPANPVTVRAPLDGVIAEFGVRPNQMVETGQMLFAFDQAPLDSRLEVAREALATARAEYRQAAQMVLNDPRSRAQIATLLGKIAEKEAQAAFLAEQSQRSRVVATRPGMAVFDDPTEWIGRPVQTGERILQLAAPDDVEIEAWVPIGDAIPLADKAPLQLYLAASPLASVSATVRTMNLRATARPDGSYAYRVRATLDAPAGQRIGLKGTAKLSGERVPLVYWILRRPLAAIRQFLAL
jgi:hypothetical protein